MRGRSTSRDQILILLEDDRNPGSHLFFAVSDPSPRQIIGGKFDGDAVARKNTNIEFAHFAGNMGQDDMSVIEFDPEHCIGKGFNDRPFNFDRFLFCQKILLGLRI